MAKKAAFGGLVIDFSKSTETLAQVFGAKPVSPGQMNSTIWAFIKEHSLTTKAPA